MDLDHVKARLEGQFRRRSKNVGDLLYLLLRQAGDVGPHLLVQKGPQLLLGDAPGQYAGDILHHGLDVGVGLVELGTQLTPVGVDGVGQAPVEGPALLGVQAGDKVLGQHRHIADDDHGTASRGDGLHPLHQLLPGQAQCGGSKNNSIL